MEEHVKWSALIVQSLSVLIIAFLTTVTGLVYAWPSYNVANFMSNVTTLATPMTTLEISLLGSLTNIGGLIATPVCGYIVDAIGRKYAAMLCGLPSVLAWSMIALSPRVPLVLAAVGIAGFGAAGQCVVSVYISEISQDSIRGALTSTTVSGYFLGILLSYTLGGYLSYHTVIYANLSLSVLYVVMVALLKESPVYYMMVGKEKEAAKSIAFYRRVEVTSKEVEVEMRNIRIQLNPKTGIQDESDPASKELIGEKAQDEEAKVSAWKFLLKSQSSKRALIAVLVSMTLSILMGSIVLQVYAEPLFKEAVPSMNANQCSIYLALVCLAASTLCCLFLDKFGRKFLMTWSSIGSGILTLLLGTQFWFRWAPHWVTAVFIYSFCFIYTLGAAIVPFILTAEVFLPEVRGLGNSISMACMWIFNFVTLVVFNPIVEAVGLGPVFCCFSIVCFIGAAYSFFCLPETKGLSADAIQALFLKRKGRRSTA